MGGGLCHYGRNGGVYVCVSVGQGQLLAKQAILSFRMVKLSYNFCYNKIVRRVYKILSKPWLILGHLCTNKFQNKKNYWVVLCSLSC